MRTFFCILLLCLSFAMAIAQRIPRHDSRPPSVSLPSTSSLPQSLPQPFALKRPGHYTLSDWRQLIDSAWGPGLPTDVKLQVFDSYWTEVDQDWGGFPNLVVNWDSLKNVYRPLIAAGVSRGRFYGILSRMTRALAEWHVYVQDTGIDSTLGIIYADSEYPNHPSFHYRAGVPLINLGASIFRTTFGAGITALDDSLAMVYSVMPNHPLNLQPGDIILGYDGIPWKKLLNELFEAELPIIGGGAVGSTPAAINRIITMYAGMNWGLFDTIDVMKYPTNEVAHYPTSPLSSIAPPYFVATEQLPVKGVAFPSLDANDLVSWGVVEGTNKGYVYARDWWGAPRGKTGIQFAQAIDDLIHTHNVKGLILDFRTNLGGWEVYANDGFKQLFNVDPTPNYGTAIRVRGNDHFQFSVYGPHQSNFFDPNPSVFDHPIAVLTGTLCGSAGDYNAFRMRFHPMVRFFGRPTTGAYTDYSASGGYYGTLVGSYFCRIDDGSVYSNYNNEGIMIHKAFPVDEDVWLTRDGVAKGQDDVVKRALDWMTTLSYAHDVKVSEDTLRTAGDSVTVTAKVENPGSRTLVVSAIVTNPQGALVDSLVLMNDGLHGDGAPGDSIWGAFIKSPVVDGKYNISVRTDDKTAGTFRRLPNAALFTVSLTGVTDLAGILPKQFILDQNYPNPFNPSTTIRFGLPNRSHITLAVFNTLGQQVALLRDGEQQAGYYEVKFDRSRLSSGVYFYRLRTEGFLATKRLLLLR